MASDAEPDRKRRSRTGAVVAVAGTAVVLALTPACAGGSTKHTAADATRSPSPTAAASPAATTPAGFPLGAWVKPGGKYRETLTFSDNAVVKLLDTRGQSAEHLTFPAAAQVTFSGDGDFCQVPGTYRYAVSHGVLHFTLVPDDGCGVRVDYLTNGVWQKQ
jgi:hypothetical protein